MLAKAVSGIPSGAATSALALRSRRLRLEQLSTRQVSSLDHRVRLEHVSTVRRDVPAQNLLDPHMAMKQAGAAGCTSLLAAGDAKSWPVGQLRPASVVAAGQLLQGVTQDGT